MNKPRNNMFTIAKDETLLLKNCLRCDENLSERWNDSDGKVSTPDSKRLRVNKISLKDYLEEAEKNK